MGGGGLRPSSRCVDLGGGITRRHLRSPTYIRCGGGSLCRLVDLVRSCAEYQSINFRTCAPGNRRRITRAGQSRNHQCIVSSQRARKGYRHVVWLHLDHRGRGASSWRLPDRTWFMALGVLPFDVSPVPRSGGLVDRYGAKPPLIIGPVVVALGFAMFAIPSVGG